MGFFMEDRKLPPTLLIVGILMFVSAFFNLSWAGAMGVAFFWIIIPICLALWAITWTVLEIIYGILLLTQKLEKAPLWIAIVEIILGALFLNPFTLGCGIANTILLTREDSKKFFEGK